MNNTVCPIVIMNWVQDSTGLQDIFSLLSFLKCNPFNFVIFFYTHCIYHSDCKDFFSDQSNSIVNCHCDFLPLDFKAEACDITIEMMNNRTKSNLRIFVYYNFHVQRYYCRLTDGRRSFHFQNCVNSHFGRPKRTFFQSS